MELHVEEIFLNKPIFSGLDRFSFMLNYAFFAKMFSGSFLALLISDSFVHFDLPRISKNLDKGHAFLCPQKVHFLFFLCQEHLILIAVDNFCSLGIFFFFFNFKLFNILLSFFPLTMTLKSII